MQKNLSRLALFVGLASLFASSASPAFAAWVWSPETGKFVNADATVQDTPQKQYDHAMAFYKKKDLKEAQQQLGLLLKRYAGSPIAPEAQYQLGTIYEEMGDYYRAFQGYRNLLQRYPQSERVSEAVEREFRIGNLFLSGKRGKLFGLDILPSGPKAVEIFKHIVEAAPYSEYGDEAQFHLGLAYKKTGHFGESIQAFQAVIDQYPNSSLKPQARFQIADTSYLQSVTATRDQRAMDQASQEIDQFLKYHPDSSVSDKAAKLRQEIDEKNAEKNYRIALFYEKENFLDSAFVYYRDVILRYPQTQWGRKAEERLEALEKPAEFLKSQEAQVAAKKQKVEEALRTVGKSDPVLKKELEGDLERMKKQGKDVKKAKSETLKRRRSALRQKEKNLQEKLKALEVKRKRFGKNLSEDLGAAFDRWQTSLEKEKAELAKEKLQIKEWEKTLGVDTTSMLTDALSSFGKEELTPLEQVHRVQAKRLGELIQDESLLLKEKEALYLKYEKFLTEAGAIQGEEVSYQEEREKLRTSAQEIEALENQLFEKERLYKKHFGISPWGAAWRAPKALVEYSVDALNPFPRSSPKDWESKSMKDLRALEEEWRERVAAQKRVVDTVAQAFDKELAALDKRRVPVAEITKKNSDLISLRRAIKQVEREIRSRYNEIQDRNLRKNQLLEQLEGLIESSKGGVEGVSRAGNFFTALPRGFRSFIFGLPQKDLKLTEEAKRLSAEGNEPPQIQELRKNIELESILIETRNQEIQSMQRELEALRAETSLAGAPHRRSILVKFPYAFMKEAVTSANRLVPKENREDELIKRLNEETGKLELLKLEAVQIENLINKKAAEKPSKSAAERVEKPLPKEEEPSKPLLPNQGVLGAEIEALKKQIQLKEESYKQEEERFEKLRWDRISKGRLKAQAGKLRDIEKALVDLIAQQQKIYQEETGLLDVKKQMVQKFLDELPHDVFTQELSSEREAIESRENELRRRDTALGEELKRLQMEGAPAVR